MVMLKCIKQHLSNILSSIYEKVIKKFIKKVICNLGIVAKLRFEH